MHAFNDSKKKNDFNIKIKTIEFHANFCSFNKP